MADGEDEYYVSEEEEDTKPKNPQYERFKRQLLACSSTIFGALAAALFSNNLNLQFLEYQMKDWSWDYIYWTPSIGDAPGVLLAVPILYFLGRRYALITSQLLFLVMLLINEYFHLHLATYQTGKTKFNRFLRLTEEFHCLLIIHGCVRISFIVMVVYVVEVAQPSLRAFFIAAIFPFFAFGLMARLYLHKTTILLPAIAVQIIAFGLALFAPESPYWLASRGQPEAAEKEFTWLRYGGDDEELAALLERAESNVDEPPLAVAFGAALAKVVFLYMGTDSVCRVFMSHLTYPIRFFRYDNTVEHEIFATSEPLRYMFMYPLVGSLVGVAVCRFVGRRIVYLGTILISLLIFYARIKYITFDMEMRRVRSAEFCYFESHMGTRQIVLLYPGEIFPTKLREVGVAISELMQFVLQFSDYKWIKLGSLWGSYSTWRSTLIPIGILLTALFMPETKDKTLIETENLGAKLVPVILPTPEIAEGLESDEEVGEEA